MLLGSLANSPLVWELEPEDDLWGNIPVEYLHPLSFQTWQFVAVTGI